MYRHGIMYGYEYHEKSHDYLGTIGVDDKKVQQEN